uniref:DUF6328 family protein n=1 Tax=uncultured Acidovorax sp. TaxID=158751 RepID=UPI0025E1AE2F
MNSGKPPSSDVKAHRRSRDTGLLESENDGDLTDMLGEMRVLFNSAQLLTAFLITVPFNPGFTNIVTTEKLVFLGTFILSVTSLVLLSAPAVQHRFVRPLNDRARFKRLATRQIVAGSVALGTQTASSMARPMNQRN